MMKVHFPQTRVPVIARLRNLVTTKGDILTPKERDYATFLTREIRENIVPWAETSEGNDRILAEIRQQFIDKVKQEEPQEWKKIICNVEDYVFKEAQYHFRTMADPSVQSVLTDTSSVARKILENAIQRDSCWKKIETVLGTTLERNKSWSEIEAELKAKNISKKQIQWCYEQYLKGSKFETKRIDNVVQREKQLAANEAAAKQYRFWKSYNYAYNFPTP